MQFQVLTLFIGFVFILNLQGTFVSSNRNVKLKYCFVKEFLNIDWRTGAQICPKSNDLDSVHEDIECILPPDRNTCLRHLIKNEIDFMIAEPQDLLLLAMNKLGDNILITGEWKESRMRFEKGQYSMVVTARKSLENFSNSKNKRYCSSGFNRSSSTQNYVKYFENKIISGNCDPKKTVLENRMSDLSEHFESVCISGTLIRDSKVYEKLSKNYNNLHSGCTTLEDPKEMDPAMCFYDNYGDLAWVTLGLPDETETFRLLQESQKKFHFLCPDGTTSDVLCIWLTIPFQTIITTKESAEKVMDFLDRIFFVNGLERSVDVLPYGLEDFKTPIHYLLDSFPEFLTTKNNLKCDEDRTVNWCVVTSLEMEKCKWISYSAQVHEIEPLIQCVREFTKEKCIESMSYGWTDVFAIKPELLSQAKNSNLQPLLHMVGKKKTGKIHDTAVIVRKSSNITSLQGLKNTKACFIDYEDHGWNTFIYLMKNMTGDKNWLCQDKKMVSDFFQEICVFDLDRKDKTFPKKLHSLCSKISTNIGNTSTICTKTNRIEEAKERYEHSSYSKSECKTIDEALLSCLTLHEADVAFVNLRSLYQHSHNPLGNNYKVLCLNGSISNNDETNECYASSRNYGSLMVHKHLPQPKKDEIYQLMMELNTLFSKPVKPNIQQMYLYGPFDGENGVIFPEGTESLEPECTLRCSLDYQEIINYIEINTASCLDSWSREERSIPIFTYIMITLVGLFLLMRIYKRFRFNRRWLSIHGES